MIEYILQRLNDFLSRIVSLWRSRFGPIIKFNSISIRVQNVIDEGGFSTIFLATDVDQSIFPTNYALKRIRCHDSASRNACIKESKVHYALMEDQKKQQRERQGGGPLIAAGGATKIQDISIESIDDALSSHFMPLLGSTFSENNSFFYMLFPYIPHSLRKEVQRRIWEPIEDFTSNKSMSLMSKSQQNQKVKDVLRMPPWSETIVLRWFEQLTDAVILMHNAGYTHRDIKLDNVLLHPELPPAMKSTSVLLQDNHMYNRASGPVLIDFGSAGDLLSPLTTRRELLMIVDEAENHTTISYRPPELFAGELRVAESNASISNPSDTVSSTVMSDDEEVDHELFLDYRKVDVWCLGCTLFAILFGASPGEVEFSRSTGKLIIVDPSHNKVLGMMPWPNDDTPPANWYSYDVKELLGWMLTHNRRNRPTMKQVRQRVRDILSHRPSFFQGNSRLTSDIESLKVDL